MWELDCEESWAPMNLCFWTVVLEKTLQSPFNSKEIKPVNPKVNQSWIFIERTDVEVEAPIIWPADAKNWLIGKDPDAGKDWRQEEKKTREDEMVGCYHRLNEHEFKQAPGVGDGQGSLVCCGPWGCKELDTTERLKWTEYMQGSWLREWEICGLSSSMWAGPSLHPSAFLLFLSWGISPQKTNSNCLLRGPSISCLKTIFPSLRKNGFGFD